MNEGLHQWLNNLYRHIKVYNEQTKKLIAPSNLLKKIK